MVIIPNSSDCWVSISGFGSGARFCQNHGTLEPLLLLGCKARLLLVFDMFEGLPTIFLGIAMDPNRRTRIEGTPEPHIVRGLAGPRGHPSLKQLHCCFLTCLELFFCDGL